MVAKVAATDAHDEVACRLSAHIVGAVDRKFTDSFDAVFEAQRARIIQTPLQAQEANGIAERFVRTVRSECLDWLPIGGAWHLERALAVFIEHYNSHRAHRSLQLAPPRAASDRALP
jgi:transposase InsO family protein